MENAFIYSGFIDPLLMSVRNRIIRHIPENNSVIDIASGTGDLGFKLNNKVKSYHGVDLSFPMISHAGQKVKKRGIDNLKFSLSDATNLHQFSDNEFDLAVISLALHQFDPEDQIPVLNEAKRVSSAVIVADYSNPLPVGYKNFTVNVIERIAGRQHFKNFRHYMQKGGIRGIISESDMNIRHEEFSSSGIFTVIVAI